MKKMLIFFLAFYSFQFSCAQAGNQDPYPKKITVTGSAEFELVPDEIYVNIKLQEYQKKFQDKKELDIIKSEFQAACNDAGLADTCITIYSYDGFNNYFWMRRKRNKEAELNSSITYQVKFNNSRQMDMLIDKLDDEATKSFDIDRTWHTKMAEYRRQVKIKAIKAARDKAIYLLDAIGEKPETLISVIELDEPATNPSSNYYNAFLNNSVYTQFRDSIKAPMTDIIFNKIKIRSDVQVIYTIR